MRSRGYNSQLSRGGHCFFRGDNARLAECSFGAPVRRLGVPPGGPGAANPTAVYLPRFLFDTLLRHGYSHSHLALALGVRLALFSTPGCYNCRLFGRWAARALHPEFPGLLDYPAWEIGRHWCRPQTPLCAGCYMCAVCPGRVGDAEPVAAADGGRDGGF
jgi:hypothetical protein